MARENLKAEVKSFWDQTSCGEVYARGRSKRAYYESHRQARYTLEPYIAGFARFDEGLDQDILEIGVGMGADHTEWARSKPRSLAGIDLSPRAIEHTKARLKSYGVASAVSVADAETLPFRDESFDLVYSWGVLHHSPDTRRAVDEVFRVLRPRAIARIMLYHKYSLTGYMLWLRYGLLRARPFRSLNDIYYHHLESPGTKAYSLREVKQLFSSFSEVAITTQLSFADLLEGAVGIRHRGRLLTLARKLWPRPLLRILFKHHGLIIKIEAIK
jgi:ubiquinone/menaquinone biosynthesis C-methylase UbiE